MRMSEARLNDLAYMTLKYLFFQPMGMESPRECDIRVVMSMAAPGCGPQGLQGMILSPTEIAPSQHERFYDVEPEAVFREAVEYMTDHWLKQPLDEAFGEAAEEKMRAYWAEVILPGVLSLPEADCGPRAP